MDLVKIKGKASTDICNTLEITPISVKSYLLLDCTFVLLSSGLFAACPILLEILKQGIRDSNGLYDEGQCEEYGRS